MAENILLEERNTNENNRIIIGSGSFENLIDISDDEDLCEQLDRDEPVRNIPQIHTIKEGLSMNASDDSFKLPLNIKEITS